MNKAELITAVSNKVTVSKNDIDEVITAFTNVITNALVDGDRVTLSGFGTYEVVERAARTARNPKTGEPISVPASKVPKFKPGKTLKNAIKA